jgi:ABC-type antimicrobial peptide transport system permease subunit
VPIQIEMISSRIRESLLSELMMATLSAFLGSLAVLLAALGLYGLMAYSVALRTNEIGIRIALGASPRSVRWMVQKDTLILAAAGAVLGIVGSLILGRFTANLLHGVRPVDPASFVAATMLSLALAMYAGYLPARRASRVDPLTALREE